MSILPTATPATEPKSPEAKNMALVYAVIIIIMLVAQLFTFDTFLTLFLDFNLPVSDNTTILLASLLVVTELFALPFLLRMKLSINFRRFSMLCGWLVALLWMFVTVWLASTRQDVSTVGFLGTIGQLTPGWWAVFIALAFGSLAAWASWGLWPSSKAKK